MIESSVPAVLRERARTRPAEAAFTFVDYERDWAGVPETLTWSQLYRRTLNVARELTASGSTGDRVVIAAPQGLGYVTAFLGALQAGRIAVPLSVPQGGVTDERFISVLSDASPSAILTTSSVAGNIAGYLESKPGASAPPVVEVDALDLNSDDGAAAEAKGRPDIAYLQYTSGSTRTPKGVEISHSNIVANFEQINADIFGGAAPQDTTMVSWLPFYHDMGLYLAIIFPVLAGFPALITSPASFLQRPARWVQALASNSRAFSAAPNFAFELAARKTSDDDLAGLDLGNVLGILNGSERVQPATLQRFAERFARFNFRDTVLRPAYGMAEATVYIATRAVGQSPEIVHFESEKLTAGHAKRCASEDGTPLVSYGVPRSPAVRIVDPDTSIECPAGTVGEIWVQGGNVAQGYWGNPPGTEGMFGATLVGATGGASAGPWLRSGDLGFFSDGELFILGRIKDLLIVNGRNHSPDDIEATIQEVTRGRCVAIGVPDDDGVENVVAIAELKNRDEPEEAAKQRMGVVRRDIATAISKAHGLSVADLVLVPPGSIPITTSGKVRRRDCVQLYLRDEFTRLDGPIRRPLRRAVEDADAGAGTDSGWTQRLRGLRRQRQSLRRQEHDLLVEVVCAQAAAVLGRPGPEDIDPESAFGDLGFDSVKATELLDRLRTETELPLPPTLAFDYPTPDELAAHLGGLLDGSVAPAPAVQSRPAADEPIAVVGMACRFPGGVDSPAALWDLVASGTDAVGRFPADRGWNLGELFDPDPDAVGKTYASAGGFLADAAGFDAPFFGISAREALSMDPQQRLLLEVCWEALEAARIDPSSLARSETGVFVGAWSQSYGASGSDGVEGYALTGLSTSVASGRVAYALGLQGPAITLDTACSSSLVAAHLACQSLRNGESSLALAGGVTVMTTPSVFTEFARQRGLAADGRCKAFSANADGTGWGEGAAVLVLERLSEARRHHRPVLAVIAGSAINQDGASNGLTAPNGPAQQRVITQAAAKAGVGLDQVDVVEAHGTGTSLGDPIEAGALIATYGAARSAERPLWLGSIKSNIGHTQAAAGVAGMIKMIEALNHDTLPPTLNVDRPSPQVDWSAGTVRLLTEPVAWPVTDHPRTAAVSSFGISGTNAHVILQQAPTPEPAERTDAGAEFGPRLWAVSARTPAALSAQADRLHHHLVSHPELDLTDVAYSLGGTRAHHPYRAVITDAASSADAREDLLAALDALRDGRAHPQLIQHHFLAHLRGKTVFVLPGQGGQYPGMGAELYARHRVFADMVDACDEALRPFTDWSVRDVLLQDPAAPSLDRVDVVQPVLFTMMVSLAEVLGHCGIVPDAVIGHSQGEIAAAYLAGVFGLPEAAKIVARRSQALSALCGAGAMASVLLGAEQLESLLRPWGAALSISAINGPSHTIVSGDPGALQQFSSACERDGIQIRPIAVDYASHCAQVEAVRERLLAELADLSPAPGRIPLYSTVGQGVSVEPLDTTTMDADYWYRNLREPVGFHDRVLERLAAGECTFVELSPHPVLAPALVDTLAQTPGRAQSAVVITLHRERPGHESLAKALAQLHTHGHSPSWPALYPHAHTVALPTYPFDHRRYWLAPAPTGDAAEPGPVAALADQGQATSASPRTLAATLAAQNPQQRLDTLTAMVTATAAAVLAHPDPAALDPDGPLKDLGIDSLTAMELRNTLNRHTGLALPATLAFDHPTPAKLARHLADLLDEPAASAVPAAPVGTRSAEPVDNRLAHVDQAVFLTMRAVHGTQVQFIWVYDRGVNLDGLRRFQSNLGCGLLGRRVERSPIPFARDHWVRAPGPDDIDIAATPRRRSDVSAWADERVRLPVDPEWGPGWHLGMLPLEDGGAAVSLVVSHTIVDGIGFVEAIADAAEGRTRDLGYPPAESRSLARAVREDLRQTARELPDIGRALVATARRAWPDRKQFASSMKAAPPSQRTAGDDQAVEVPALTAYIDPAEWDARAKNLVASSNSLVAGVACRLAARVGRVRDDGKVTLRFPVSLRTAGDTRGNALTVVDVAVDPTLAATDLRDTQATITRAILAGMENPDEEFLATFPLAAMVPRRLNRRLAAMAAGGASLPVTVSNFGDLSAAVNRPDGSDADYAYMRSYEPDIKKSTLEHIGGQLFVGSGRGNGKIFLRISAYVLGRENTKNELREIISRTLAEFDLTAEIDS
ncbi:type I polyketide synthase [Mycobacterium paraense]|uniref:type I polyketide synthase n=1 Tax=Mycobacterium paraense TaxID=767916 RepID=UPI000A166F68|nr:type I polyketide synthase [Mycobacterium paraense]MCV7442422.1 type I polyketide synthase [Mycobacterium paraense]